MTVAGGDARSRRSVRRRAVQGLDEYSEVLGMTPREHERRMRKWYVLLAIVCFFGVFGEGILMLASRARSRDAGATVEAPAAHR